MVAIVRKGVVPCPAPLGVVVEAGHHLFELLHTKHEGVGRACRLGRAGAARSPVSEPISVALGSGPFARAARVALAMHK